MMTKIKNIAVWISVVIGALMAVYGAYSLFTSKIIEKDRTTQSEIVLKQEVTDLKESVNNLVIQTTNNADTLGIIYRNQINTNKQVKKISNGMVNHFKQTDRIEELFNWTIE
jgi:hypothetical protein